MNLHHFDMKIACAMLPLVDGLHLYESVKHDWENWIGKLAPGGIALLHDVAVRHADFGVWRLWEEICARYETFEFHHCYGLGVVRKPGATVHGPGILDYLFDHWNAAAIRRHYLSCAERIESKADLAAVAVKEPPPVFQSGHSP